MNAQIINKPPPSSPPLSSSFLSNVPKFTLFHHDYGGEEDRLRNEEQIQSNIFNENDQVFFKNLSDNPESIVNIDQLKMFNNANCDHIIVDEGIDLSTGFSYIFLPKVYANSPSSSSSYDSKVFVENFDCLIRQATNNSMSQNNNIEQSVTNQADNTPTNMINSISSSRINIGNVFSTAATTTTTSSSAIYLNFMSNSHHHRSGGGMMSGNNKNTSTNSSGNNNNSSSNIGSTTTTTTAQLIWNPSFARIWSRLNLPSFYHQHQQPSTFKYILSGSNSTQQQQQHKRFRAISVDQQQQQNRSLTRRAILSNQEEIKTHITSNKTAETAFKQTNRETGLNATNQILLASSSSSSESSSSNVGERNEKQHQTKQQQHFKPTTRTSSEIFDEQNSEKRRYQHPSAPSFSGGGLINQQQENLENRHQFKNNSSSESEVSLFDLLKLDQFQHLTLAEKHRLERLFHEIDVDGNGVIDFNDLFCALERKGIKATHDNVKHLILRSDMNLDGDVDFAEFVSYCLENEKQLRIIFKDIDMNEDGKIDSVELVDAFKRAGVVVDESEALRLVRRIKSPDSVDGTIGGNTIELNYHEFRDYLLLHPTDSLQDFFRSWRHGTFVDFGEDGLMPVDFDESEMISGMWWRHLIAGGIAGAVSRTSTAPLDRLKVFLQVRGAEFNGLGMCLRHMLQEGGFWSLWRGNGINVIKIAPETAIKFMAFDQLKRYIQANNNTGEISIIERFVAGSCAGAISQSVIYPMEVLKTKFCLRHTGQYTGMWDAAKKIYSNGGVKNFYRGYVPNLIGILPYAGIDLTVYETLKKMYLKTYSLEEPPIFVCLSCGTISSTFGQIASYPLALIRTRMQNETGANRVSMKQMFKSIYQREGFRGLYRGITANIMKVAPAVSISYVVYEYSRRPLGAVVS